jgi:hypothetical protein
MQHAVLDLGVTESVTPAKHPSTEVVVAHWVHLEQ